ncbi:MAG: indolepyruvate ferredoxin oxidoreductase subunit alpha [Aggregatilineales bacterium]
MFKRHEPPTENRHLASQTNGKSERRVVVDHNLCFFCGACVAVCPPDAIFLETAFLNINDQTCTLCERCVNMCPVHALSMAEGEPTARAE